MKIRTLELPLKDGYSITATLCDSEDIIGRRAVLLLFKRLRDLEELTTCNLIDSITKIPGVTFKVSWYCNDQTITELCFRESVEV